ncbi:MAG: DUF2806 domain-containing protein [FCB group bacterium]
MEPFNAIDKLLGIIEKYGGYIFEPGMKTRLLKADARGEVRAEIEKVKGIGLIKEEYTKLDIPDEFKSPLMEQSMKRIGFTFLKEQENINDVVDETYKQLEGETVTSEPIDDDWITRFFGYAKNISNQEIQIIWSKILAGEIRKPGSFSYLTLNVLQNIDYQIAKYFLQMAKYVIKAQDKYIVPSALLNHEHKNFINFSVIYELDSIGLINQRSFTGLEIHKQNHPINFYFLNCNKVIHLQAAAIKNAFQIEAIILSKAGKELISLIDVVEPDDYFIEQFVKYLYSIDKDFSIWVADIINIEENGIKYKNQQHIPYSV